jgi:cell division protein FtsZ
MNTGNEPVKTPRAPGREVRLRVFGVGGAGCNAVERMIDGGFDGVSFAAVNTDVDALLDLSAEWILPVGAALTRGLGTGGDPELGRAAAEEDVESFRKLCRDSQVTVIVAGLGGGVGTGASPVLARIAKEAGALVLAIVTLPFDFEGNRRQRQALQGLERLKEAADAVICLPNQRALQLIDENTSVIETFRIANRLLVEGFRGIWRLLTRPGIINVDFADLCSVVRGRHSENAFATVEARGEHRCRDLVEKMLAHPLLERGATLCEADAVLVSLVGGKGLTMAEVHRVMAEINRPCADAEVIVGATVDPDFEDRLSLTVIAARRRSEEPQTNRVSASEPENPAAAPRESGTAGGEDRRISGDPEMVIEAEFFDSSPTARPRSRFVAPAPDLSQEQKEQILAQQNGVKPPRKTKSRMRQGTLPLEIVSKGRFEKSEPTIYQGEDLDVPTYIRRGVPLN